MPRAPSKEQEQSWASCLLRQSAALVAPLLQSRPFKRFPQHDPQHDPYRDYLTSTTDACL